MGPIESEQDALLLQAGQALARHDPRGALALLDRADALGRTHNSLLNRSVAYRLLGDFTAAIGVLYQALELQP